MRRIYITILFSLFIRIDAQVQPQYSNYIYCANGYNPAFAGSRDALAFAMLYRNQWTGIEGSPAFYFLTADAQLQNQKIALGTVLSSEEYGISKNQRLQFNYAYRIPVSRGRLSMGLGGGITTLSSQFNEIKTVDPNDRVFSGASENAIFPAASAGIYYFTNRIFSGFSVPELFHYTMQGKEGKKIISSTPAAYNYYFTAGYHPVFTENFKLLASTFLKYQPQQGLSPEITAFAIWPEVMAAGISYRPEQALTGLLRIDLTRQFKIHYAYEFTTGYLNAYGNGSHEILLHYEFSYVIKAVNPRFR